MSDTPEPELLVAVKGLLGPVISAALGLAWRRTAEIRRGDRITWRALVLDVPSVVGFGLLAGSLAMAMDLPLLVAMGLACALAHVGTEWLLAVAVPRLLDRLAPRDPWASTATTPATTTPPPAYDNDGEG